MSDKKYDVNAPQSQIGVIGDHAKVDVHFYKPPRSLPLQRPTRPEHFTGRESELKKLLNDLQPGRTVTLCGPGGIGKSALAAEAVWQLTPENKPPERFPDGIIWHDFYREPESNKALEHIALSFGKESRPTPLDAAKRALSGRQALLLLDGTEDADNLPAVLEITGNCGVLVTTRKHKDAASDRQDIESLDLDKAVELLKVWGKEQVSDDNIARRICELVGGLPLAVRLAGRYLCSTGETASEYLEWLQKTPLDALDQGKRKLESVPIMLERSLDQVSESSRNVLSVAGLLAFVSFSREVIMAALQKNQLQKPFDELVANGILLHSDKRYVISHTLIHTS